MTFAVRWHRRAIRELAEIYLVARATGRTTTVTAAAAQIDKLLGSDPVGCSESRSDELRFLYISPLAIDFTIKSRERLVLVRTVRYRQPRHR